MYIFYILHIDRMKVQEQAEESFEVEEKAAEPKEDKFTKVKPKPHGNSPDLKPVVYTNTI